MLLIDELTDKIGNEHLEYKIIESNSKHNRVEMVFIRKDGTYLGTEIVRYPFRIILYELGIKY